MDPNRRSFLRQTAGIVGAGLAAAASSGLIPKETHAQGETQIREKTPLNELVKAGDLRIVTAKVTAENDQQEQAAKNGLLLDLRKVMEQGFDGTVYAYCYNRQNGKVIGNPKPTAFVNTEDHLSAEKAVSGIKDGITFEVENTQGEYTTLPAGFVFIPLPENPEEDGKLEQKEAQSAEKVFTVFVKKSNGGHTERVLRNGKLETQWVGEEDEIVAITTTMQGETNVENNPAQLDGEFLAQMARG